MNNTDYMQYDLFETYDKIIANLMSLGKKEEAQKRAFEWLHQFSGYLCVSVPWNWKIAKKQIAAYYFGKRPSLQIFSKDEMHKLFDFIQNHKDKVVRCTYHKYNAACHSESRRVDSNDLSWITAVSEGMLNRDVIDVFIENPTSSFTCFRRFSLQYNEEIAYEMGYGQAMYVFEAERGQHDTASVHIINDNVKWENAMDSKLTDHLRTLLCEHEDYYAIKTRTLCYFLGIPQISLEGYFNIANPSQKPFVVDIDLPFDKAFF